MFDNHAFIISVYLCVLSVSVVYHSEIFTTEAQSTRRNTELMFDNHAFIISVYLCVLSVSVVYHLEIFTTGGTKYTKEHRADV
jgi:hypothetical protein